MLIPAFPKDFFRNIINNDPYNLSKQDVIQISDYCSNTTREFHKTFDRSVQSLSQEIFNMLCEYECKYIDSPLRITFNAYVLANIYEIFGSGLIGENETVQTFNEIQCGARKEIYGY